MENQEEDPRAFLDDLERRWCLVAQARAADAQSSDELFAFVTLIINRLPDLVVLGRECLVLRKELAELRQGSAP